MYTKLIRAIKEQTDAFSYEFSKIEEKDKAIRSLIFNFIFYSVFDTEGNHETWFWCWKNNLDLVIKNGHLIDFLINNFIENTDLNNLKKDFEIVNIDGYFYAKIDFEKIKILTDLFNYKGYKIKNGMIYNQETCFLLTNKVPSNINTLELLDAYLETKEKKNRANPNYDLAKQIFKKLVDDGLSYQIYPTTYGIGVFSILNFNFEQDKETVEKILIEKNLDFQNEWSDAGWVFRYKISKSKTNLLKI